MEWQYIMTVKSFITLAQENRDIIVSDAEVPVLDYDPGTLLYSVSAKLARFGDEKFIFLSLKGTRLPMTPNTKILINITIKMFGSVLEKMF
jgi:hypothetical protein